jgi:hypothetical protein
LCGDGASDRARRLDQALQDLHRSRIFPVAAVRDGDSHENVTLQRLVANKRQKPLEALDGLVVLVGEVQDYPREEEDVRILNLLREIDLLEVVVCVVEVSQIKIAIAKIEQSALGVGMVHNHGRQPEKLLRQLFDAAR